MAVTEYTTTGMQTEVESKFIKEVFALDTIGNYEPKFLFKETDATATHSFTQNSDGSLKMGNAAGVYGVKHWLKEFIKAVSPDNKTKIAKRMSFELSVTRTSGAIVHAGVEFLAANYGGQFTTTNYPGAYFKFTDSGVSVVVYYNGTQQLNEVISYSYDPSKVNTYEILIIHMGTSETGSSIIQVFFKINGTLVWTYDLSKYTPSASYQSPGNHGFLSYCGANSYNNLYSITMGVR